MTRFKRWAAIAVALVASVAALVGLASPADAIVGGQPVTSAYPQEVTLLYDHGDGRGPVMHCGATEIATFPTRQSVVEWARYMGPARPTDQQIDQLVGTTWYESNAHCGTDYITPSATPLPVSALRIGAGSPRRSQQDQYPVAETDVYSGWDWGLTTGPNGELGDVLLIKVAAIVPGVPVPLGAARIGQQDFNVGWGYTVVKPDNTSQAPDMLQQVRATVVPSSQCAVADPPISPGEICTLTQKAGESECNGDSGSESGHEDALVGSASRGRDDDLGLCDARPGIYTAVSYYRGWIATSILGGPEMSRFAAPKAPTPAAVNAARAWAAAFRAGA